MPLLGVLPGTGGLTRVTDKRHVRHDLADIFCARNERRARPEGRATGGLVDAIAKPAQFADAVQERAPMSLAKGSDRPADGNGVALTPLQRSVDAAGYRYEHVDVAHRSRRAHGHVHRARARGAQPTDVAGIEAAGAQWWPLAMARELDDAILSLRTNELALGTWLLKTQGDAAVGLAVDATLLQFTAPLARPRDDRPPAADVRAPGRHVAHAVRAGRAALLSSRARLFELALAADRGYMAKLARHAGARAARCRNGTELRHVSDGEWPIASRPPLLRRSRPARCGAWRDRQDAVSRWKRNASGS